ncbi:helix-turn-helix transcriptional regulator [Marimonas lutisalis]|uniref:helix-turn-helix transcriptional regulator n=1 Tax=Marimonas lutisalis TaxID=2545756 RepID=UPI0010F606B1|nr:AlpA family transcriptional regulator [Marimonas lutisalis]
MAKCEDNRLLNRSEVEELFGIPTRFLELAVARDDGPPVVRLGRLVRYRICDVRRWIEERVEGDFHV